MVCIKSRGVMVMVMDDGGDDGEKAEGEVGCCGCRSGGVLLQKKK
jgi:hypothetical protein